MIIISNTIYKNSYLAVLNSHSPEMVERIISKAFEIDETVLTETEVVTSLGEKLGLTLFDPLQDPALPLDQVFSIIEAEDLPSDPADMASYYDHALGVFVPNTERLEVVAQETVATYMESLKIGIGADYDTAIQQDVPQHVVDALAPSELVEIRICQLEKRFQFIMHWITHKYTRDEVSSWSEQKRDLDCWEALGSKTVANAPDGLKALAMEAHGITDEINLDPVLHIQERADDVAANANFYRPYSLGAVGKKKKHKKSLKEKPTDTTGKTAQEITTMKTNIMAVDSNDFLTFGIQKFIDAGLL